jgi:hypothetical protein
VKTLVSFFLFPLLTRAKRRKTINKERVVMHTEKKKKAKGQKVG